MAVSFTCYLPNVRPTFQKLDISPDVSREKSGAGGACSLCLRPDQGERSAPQRVAGRQ